MSEPLSDAVPCVFTRSFLVYGRLRVGYTAADEGVELVSKSDGNDE